MPDRYYAEGSVDLKMIVFLKGVPVEGYGQTEQEAEDDATEDVLDTAQNDPSGLLSQFARYIDDYSGDAFITAQRVKVKEIQDQSPLNPEDF